PSGPDSSAHEPAMVCRAAKVAVIEYSDFQCPFCGRYAKESFPQITSDYVDTGKVKYVFHDLPLDFHKYAFKAAEAAHCAGEQGKFWEMHGLLFQNQAALAPEQLGGYAKDLGRRQAAFPHRLDSGRVA